MAKAFAPASEVEGCPLSSSTSSDSCDGSQVERHADPLANEIM
jgi:hypothetical protein